MYNFRCVTMYDVHMYVSFTLCVCLCGRGYSYDEKNVSELVHGKETSRCVCVCPHHNPALRVETYPPKPALRVEACRASNPLSPPISQYRTS